MAKSRVLHRVIGVAMLGIAAVFLAFAMSRENAANRDFICYWAAGKQLIHHSNPYDGPGILAVERAAGFSDRRPFFMRNPPIAFFMTLPLAAFSARVGVVLWSLAIIAALMMSVHMIWDLQGRPADRLHLVGYLFPPALACLLAGQIGIFLLLGVVLFLRFRESRPFFAGAALLLGALKPQLFLPFGAVLMLWAILNRAFRLISGFGFALASSIALAYGLDADGWAQYSRMIHSAGLRDEFIPTVSLMFRLALHREWLWLQSVPTVVGTLWAIGYFLKGRNRWDWLEGGLLILSVSVMVAPYAWFTDEAVVLPAILVSLYRASDSGRSLIPFGCVAMVALLGVLYGAGINSGLYVWTAPAWVAWVMYSMGKRKGSVVAARGVPSQP